MTDFIKEASEGIIYHPATVPSCCKNIKDTKEVCLECLEALVNHHLPTCKLIHTGKIISKRHEVYRKGHKARRDLDFQCYSVRYFTDDQQDFAIQLLKREFCKHGSTKPLNYILRVLKEEIFIRIFADLMSIGYTAADRKMQLPN